MKYSRTTWQLDQQTIGYHNDFELMENDHSHFQDLNEVRKNSNFTNEVRMLNKNEFNIPSVSNIPKVVVQLCPSGT